MTSGSDLDTILVYMCTKMCVFCNKKFSKPYNRSVLSWQTAKYCSKSCGRKANNPAKLKPNKFYIKEGAVFILIKSKKGNFKCLVDEDVYKNSKDIRQTRWSLSSYGYAESSYTIEDKHKKKYLHKLILKPISGMVIDHINGNPLDNRINNLRYLSHANNIRNQKNRKYKYGCSGIRKKGKKYEARIGKSRIGLFPSLESAIKARIESEKSNWGISFTEERLFGL